MANEAKIQAYRDAVITAQMCAQMLSVHNIDGLLADIATADSVGPMLDPTLWRDKHKAMDEDRELLEAALKLRRFAVKR